MTRKGPPKGVDVDHEGVYSGAEMANKPETDTKLRRCKICKKRLTIYNLNVYCLAHQIEGQKLEDIKEDAIKRAFKIANAKKMNLRAKKMRREKKKNDRERLAKRNKR